jgi:hypothetical protein
MNADVPEIAERSSSSLLVKSPFGSLLRKNVNLFQITHFIIRSMRLVGACSLVEYASDFDLTRRGVQGSNLGGGRKFPITY